MRSQARPQRSRPAEDRPLAETRANKSQSGAQSLRNNLPGRLVGTTGMFLLSTVFDRRLGLDRLPDTGARGPRALGACTEALAANLVGKAGHPAVGVSCNRWRM